MRSDARVSASCVKYEACALRNSREQPSNSWPGDFIGAIVVRSHLTKGHQMALEHLELLTILEADNIFGLDGCAHRNRRSCRFAH